MATSVDSKALVEQKMLASGYTADRNSGRFRQIQFWLLQTKLWQWTTSCVTGSRRV